MSVKLRETTVEEVCDVFDGPHATPAKTTSGPIFLGITSLNKGRINLSESEHLSEEDFSKWTRRVTPRAGDVVFSYETKLGEAAIIPEGLRCCLGRRMALMRPDSSKLDGRFLLYYYLGPEFQDVIRQRTIHGSTVERLALLEFPKFPLRLPPLSEQRAIASVLGSLDDKIELNRRMNETLEALAQTLFKSWFVDATQSALPKGWRVSTLGEHVELRRGNTYKSALKDLPGPYLLGLASIHRNGGFRRGSLSTYGGESSPNILLSPGDLYVSLKDVTQSADLLGAVARVPPDIKQGRLTQDTVKLVFKNAAVSSNYIYRALRTPEYREYCRAHATGTTNLGLSREDFLSYEVVIAPDGVQQKFDAAAEALERRFDTNDAESRTLAALRDALLPKLLSGELRVPTKL